MSAASWTVTKDAREGSVSSLPTTDGFSKSRTCAFDPSILPFDHKTHTSAEVDPSDQLFGLVKAHLSKPGVVLEEDAISFAMSVAEKGRGRKHEGGCCGGGASLALGNTDHASQNLESVSVSLGLGLFRFNHKGNELRVLHQHVGDPVGTNCGPSVLSSLVFFREGTGPAAAGVIREFLAEVLAESEKTAKNTFQVYRWNIRYQFWNRVSQCVARPVSSVVLPKETGDELVKDLAEFLSEETAEFYHNHGIPYKRSYLFYGVPGSGKTSIIQALAGHFRRNVCYLSPTHPDLSDDSLKSAMERVPDNAVVVLEDVDALFGKRREKKISQSPLTFSGLLNALDGVGNYKGTIFVLTTNFKDQLDEALIRDGRVDKRVHFDYCTPEQMEKLFDNFYQTDVTATSPETAVTDADPEVAALEAQLAALKKAKATVSKDGKAPEVTPNGAAFRDALLLALGSHKVSAAQLQSFFVTHRKSTAAEAIADVASIVKCIEKRKQEEGAEANESAKVAVDAPVVPKTTDGSSSTDGIQAGGIHLHIHSCDQ